MINIQINALNQEGKLIVIFKESIILGVLKFLIVYFKTISVNFKPAAWLAH